MENHFPAPVYPSQLSALKFRAAQFSHVITKNLNLPDLSAFKSTDLLAVSLGYKGGSDLAAAAKARSSNDKYSDLLLFGDESFAARLEDSICKSIPELSRSSARVYIEGFRKLEKVNTIPLYKRQTLQGKTSGEQVIPEAYIDKTAIPDHLLNSNLVSMVVDNDDMNPLISKGDYVIIDPSTNQFSESFENKNIVHYSNGKIRIGHVAKYNPSDSTLKIGYFNSENIKIDSSDLYGKIIAIVPQWTLSSIMS